MPANWRRDDRSVEGSDHRARRSNGLLNSWQGERSVVTRLIVPDLSDPDAIVIRLIPSNDVAQAARHFFCSL